MDESVSEEDRRLIDFLNCARPAFTKGELEAWLKAELWRREDPPLWIVNILDQDSFRETPDFVNPCPGPLSGLSRTHHAEYLSREQQDVFWAIQELRWPVDWNSFDPVTSRDELMAAYRNHPEIVARFRELFPDITWEEPIEG